MLDTWHGHTKDGQSETTSPSCASYYESNYVTICAAESAFSAEGALQ